MAIKVQCACGKAFAAKDELAGKTVKCPGCQKPVKIPGAATPATKSSPPAGGAAAAKPSVAKPSASKPSASKPSPQKAAAKPEAAKPAGNTNDLFDEIGLQAVVAGTKPCPGCTEPMPVEAVVCIKCGYNSNLGRRMSTQKEESSGHEGDAHGAVAQDLMNRAALVIDDDAAEEKKKTTEGMPWWFFLIVLLALLGLATWMLFNWGKEDPKDEKKARHEPKIERLYA
jgi:hypothetical protein